MHLVTLISVVIFCLSPDVVLGIKLGAFNIQVFGVTKMGKTDVVKSLIEILSRYDIVLVQEIRDASQQAFPELVKQMNGAPYAVKFQSDLTDKADFVLIGSHVKPSDAFNEINALKFVFDDVKEHWSTEDIILMGDLNADCSYLSDTKYDELVLRNDPNYVWLLSKDDDTTVGASDCAYDRFIATKNMMSGVKDGSASVYRFDEDLGLTLEQAKNVSDHYPIELMLKSCIERTVLTSNKLSCDDRPTDDKNAGCFLGPSWLLIGFGIVFIRRHLVLL